MASDGLIPDLDPHLLQTPDASDDEDGMVKNLQQFAHSVKQGSATSQRIRKQRAKALHDLPNLQKPLPEEKIKQIIAAVQDGLVPLPTLVADPQSPGIRRWSLGNSG